jgi:RHS repeat-associated protein
MPFTTITGCSTQVALINTYIYDPWGQIVAQTGSQYNPYQFTGTYLDAATGLNQMGARYYQPGSGRFTQLDPLPCTIMEGQRYTYAKADPANLVDPDGLYPCYWARSGTWKWWGPTPWMHWSCSLGCWAGIGIITYYIPAYPLIFFVAKFVAGTGGGVACWNFCSRYQYGWNTQNRLVRICGGGVVADNKPHPNAFIAWW